MNEGSQEFIAELQLLLSDPTFNPNYKDQDNFTPLHTSCWNGHTEVLKLLLDDKRVNVNEVNSLLETPFWIACSNGRLEIVKILLNDERVDRNRESKFDVTPFYMACRNGHVEIVKILLINDEKNDVNRAEKQFRTTPFWVACYNGHIEIVKLLLDDERIDINQVNVDGETPLMVACKNGHINIVENILSNGKEVNLLVKNKEGNTVIDIARKLDKTDLVELLKKFKKMSEGPTYNIEYKDNLFKLKTRAQTFLEFENAIKSKIKLEENVKIILHYKEEQSGETFVFNDMSDLVVDSTIKVSINRSKLSTLNLGI